MKKINLSAIMCGFILSVTLFCSCSKSKDKPASATNSVVGYWFGSFDNGTINQSILFRSDGTLKVYDFYNNPKSTDTTIAYDGTGTYSVNGTTLTTHTSFPNGQKFTGGTATINFDVTPPTFKVNVGGDVYTKQ